MNTSNLPLQNNSVAEKVSHAIDQADALASRGVEAVRDGAQQIRDKAHSVSDSTVSYIKEEPVKAVLIAAAAGAALMALLSLASRSGYRS